MAKHSIELAIGSTFSGEGFNKLNSALKASKSTVTSTANTVSMVANQFEGLGGTLGKVAGTASKLLGGFLSMGVWGLVIGAVTSLVGLFDKLIHPVDEVTEGFRRQQKELKSLDAMARGYQRRIQSWKDAAQAREQAEKDAAEAAKKAEAERKRVAEESWRMGRQYEGLLAQIAAEETKAGLQSKDANKVLQTRVKLMAQAANAEVKDKRMGLAAARESGSLDRVTIAEKELELALKKRETAKAEAKALIDAYDKAKQAEQDTADEAFRRLRVEDLAREAAQKKRLEYEKLIAKTETDAAEKKKRIEDEIARTRLEADRLEENAQRARGKSVGQWEREERDRSREERKQARLQAGRTAQAERELARLERMNPKALTEGQRARMGRLREWLADQDPKNNPALKRLEELQRKRDKIAEDSLKELKDINKKFNAL